MKYRRFLRLGPFSKRGGGGLENFGQKLKFLGFFQLRSPLYSLNFVDSNNNNNNKIGLMFTD